MSLLKLISSVKKVKTRVLFVSFNEEGMSLEKIVYLPCKSSVRFPSSPRLIKEVTEKNFRNSRKFKICLKLVFFPFPYKIVVSLSRSHCQSRCSLLGYKRESPKKSLTIEEINSFLLQNLWKLIETQKKELVRKKEFEEIDVLLVDNTVCGIKIDKKLVPQNLQDLSGFSGKIFKINIAQTFVQRLIFADFIKTIPKRAKLTAFAEEGVNLATALYLKRFFEGKKYEEDAPFLIFALKERETEVFVFNGQCVHSYDRFRFGFRNLYQTFNNLLGVDLTVFEGIIKVLETDQVSLKTKKYFLEVINKELKNFYNGIISLRKNCRISNFYVDGGKLDGFLRKYDKIAPLLIIREDLFLPFKEPDSKENLYLQSDLGTVLEDNFRKSLVNNLAIKLIRWLIPHNIQVE